jgi:hypothetical protein
MSLAFQRQISLPEEIKTDTRYTTADQVYNVPTSAFTPSARNKIEKQIMQFRDSDSK